jgi:hypothetical protein
VRSRFPGDTVSAPPTEIELLWCPVCERTDRYPLLSEQGTHYRSGQPCKGRPIRFTYRRKDIAPETRTLGQVETTTTPQTT